MVGRALPYPRCRSPGCRAAWSTSLAKGYLAVDFFFLLSGFVIWLSWGERLRDGGWRAVPGVPAASASRGSGRCIWSCSAARSRSRCCSRATGRHDPAEFSVRRTAAARPAAAELGLHRSSWPGTTRPGRSAASSARICCSRCWRSRSTGGALPSWRWSLAIAAALLLLLARSRCAAQPTLGNDIPRFGLVRCLIEFAAGTVDLRAVAAVAWRAAAARADRWLPRLALLAAGSPALPETLAIPLRFAALLLALALTSRPARQSARQRAAALSRRDQLRDLSQPFPAVRACSSWPSSTTRAPSRRR